MSYFTDSAFEKMMVQKPQYSAVPNRDSPPKKEQKVRKLIIVHENTGAKKQEKEGK